MGFDLYKFATLQWDIDFHGQALADKIFQAIIILFSIVAFLAGYVMHSFTVTWQIWAAGFALAALAALPPWPWYNRHPVKWLPEAN